MATTESYPVTVTRTEESAITEDSKQGIQAPSGSTNYYNLTEFWISVTRKCKITLTSLLPGN